MKTCITIEIEASESITETLKRGSFKIDKDGSGHKIIVSDDLIIPARKCSVKFKKIPKKPKEKVKK